MQLIQFYLEELLTIERKWQLPGNMGTTVDAGQHCCSDTRDVPGDRRVFLCHLGGLGVWM